MDIMESCKAVLVFNIPEILVMISQNLNSHDMAMTMATCKNLARQLEPILWKHLKVGAHPPFQDSILRNRRYIETLYLSSLNTYDIIALSHGLLSPPTATEIKILNPTSVLVSDTKSDQPSVNTPILRLGMMQHIEINTSIIPEQLLPILNHCPNLTHLEISTSFIFDLGSFQDSLRNNLRQLLHLSLTGPALHLETALPLLRVCLLHPQLQELIFAFHVYISYEEGGNWNQSQSRLFSLILEDLKNSDDSSSPFRSNITSLTLPTHDYGYPLSFVEPLLKDHLSNIERLTIPMLNRYGDDDEDDEDDEGYEGPGATQAMKEAIPGLCPKLQHLTIMFDDSNHDISYLELFIAESTHGGIGLKSYRAYSPDDDSYFDTLETLLDYHFDTLEEIELIDCVVAKSENLQYIFTCCKNLKRFWATPGDGGSVELSFADISREEWVCLEMRELRLNLILGDSADVSHDKAGAASMAKKAYAQIGQLIKLEKLSLGCYFDRYVMSGYQLSRSDLTLENGFLAELAGLSKLRHFHMFTDLWSKMGKAEVKFIHEHWICLERITFGEDNIVSRAVFDQPHWRWLKEQRPGLIFDYDDYDNYD